KLQDLIDPAPAIHRFAVGKKIGSAADWAAGRQGVCRQQVGVSSVFDVDGVDHVLAAADPPQRSAASSLEKARDQLLIARAPDQMRSQSAGEEICTAGR